MTGIILYGPPASGKSTIAKLLAESHEKAGNFQLLKTGDDSKGEYQTISEEELREFEAAGNIVWSNERYGSIYAIDRHRLREAAQNGSLVIQLGQPEAVEAVTQTSNTEWLKIQLWCSRSVAVKRLTERDPEGVEQRLKIWDNTSPISADLTINTKETDAPQALKAIRNLIP